MYISARFLVTSMIASTVVVSLAMAVVAQQPGTVTLRPRVMASPTGVPPVRVAVDRTRVPVGDQVRFTLSPASVIHNPQLRVTLYFGDGSQQEMHQTEVVHLYRSPGDYAYMVLVKPIDPSLGTTQPSRIPDVKLSANPTKIAPGNQVNFTAQLSFAYPSVLYRFVFGDKTDSGWQVSPAAAHPYSTEGNYEAFVDIGVGKKEPLKRSNRVQIQVTPRQTQLGPVDLIANPNPADVGGQVSFTARIDSREPNLRYRFAYGDSSPPTPWQLDPQTAHIYSAPGKYTAQVEVGLMNRRAVGSTNRKASRQIEVRPLLPLGVSLNANPTNLERGGSVSFKATVHPTGQNLSYRFDFGDGSQSTWQSGAQAKHLYSTPGNYSARVEVRALGARAGARTAMSKPISIEVRQTNFSVELTVTPPSVMVGLPVFFSAAGAPANPQTRYRFSFGDGSRPSAWSARPHATHSYAASGNYSASVEIAQSTALGARPLASSTKQVNIQALPTQTPTPRPTPTPKSTPRPTPTVTRSPTPRPTATPSTNASPATTPGGRTTPSPGETTLPGGTTTPSPVGTNTPAAGGTTTPSPGGTTTPSPNGTTSPAIAGISPTPTSSPGETASAGPTQYGPAGPWVNWWKYLIIAAIILLAVYQTAKLLLGPRPTFVPHVDAGASSVSKEGGPLGFNVQIQLDPDVSEGKYGIDTRGAGLIKSERSSNG